jgi:hypothetical protein
MKKYFTYLVGLFLCLIGPIQATEPHEVEVMIAFSYFNVFPSEKMLACSPDGVRLATTNKEDSALYIWNTLYKSQIRIPTPSQCFNKARFISGHRIILWKEILSPLFKPPPADYIALASKYIFAQINSIIIYDLERRAFSSPTEKDLEIIQTKIELPFSRLPKPEDDFLIKVIGQFRCWPKLLTPIGKEKDQRFVLFFEEISTLAILNIKDKICAVIYEGDASCKIIHSSDFKTWYTKTDGFVQVFQLDKLTCS